MTKRKRELSTDEKRLWRRVAEGVKTRRLPLRDEDDDGAPPEPQKKPKHTPVSAPEPRPLRPTVAKEIAPPADRRGEKRVRRGRLEIDSTLDLHGHTQASGRAALARFLRAAQTRGERTVIVVTGVGRAGEGVLRRQLPEWLGEPGIRAIVSGFAQAHRSHGGSGAFYVFLKRPREEV